MISTTHELFQLEYSLFIEEYFHCEISVSIIRPIMYWLIDLPDASAAYLIDSKFWALNANLTGTVISCLERQMADRHVLLQVTACLRYVASGLLHDRQAFALGMVVPPLRVGERVR